MITSPRQQEMLELMVMYCRNEGCPPSIRLLCEQMGITSTNGGVTHLVALIKKGLVVKTACGHYVPVSVKEHMLTLPMESTDA